MKTVNIENQQPLATIRVSECSYSPANKHMISNKKSELNIIVNNKNTYIYILYIITILIHYTLW